MITPRIIIIGAGPCGLGAGWRLTELGYKNFLIVERDTHVGGLASSYRDVNGFTWDIGGHVLHSHYDYFDRVFESVMQGKYLTHERESWIWVFNRFVPYPFQNNIHHLPSGILNECLAGLRGAIGNNKKIYTFAQWIVASYGEGIAKHFLLPYNRKVWAYPPERMNYKWVGDRVASVDLARIERNIKEKKDDVSWGPNAVFQFPSHGGTGRIWEGVADMFRSQIQLNKDVISIDTKKHLVKCVDGSMHLFDNLLTTMPIDRLVAMTTGLSQTVLKPRLHYSSVSVVGIGIKGEVSDHLRGKCWMYFPEDSAPFFRATVFSNYSPNNAPKGTWSLMMEVAISRYRPAPSTDIVSAVIEGAIKTRLIKKNDTIVSTWVFTTKYGYPTPTLDRDAVIDRILPVFEKQGISSRGRFGAWRYEVSNQDHTFMQGVEWVNKVLNGRKEVTVFHPEIVNGKK